MRAAIPHEGIDSRGRFVRMAARLLQWLILVATLGAISLPLPAAAQSSLRLVDAWQAARQSDPEFRAARHALEAGLQDLPIARAGLLPAISLSSSASKIRGDRVAPGANGPVEQDLDYLSRSTSLSLRQPIYNREAMARYELGELQAEYSRATFAAAEQDLVVRVASAYFDVLLAQDVIALSEAQLRAYEDQARRAQRMMDRGEGTRTEIADAQARAAMARAELISAQDKLTVARQTLAAMVGGLPTALPVLAEGWAPPPLQRTALEAWLDTARDSSPVIGAQRLSVERAEREIKRVRAGHYPRLDFIASVSDSKSDSVTTIDQRTRQRAIGLQLNVPIYAGGGVEAQALKAVYNRERELARLDAQTDRVLLDVRRNYLGTTNAWARIEAYQAAVDAAAVVQRGVEVGVQAGLRSPSDVLEAARLVYVAQRDLASSRFEYLVGRLKLQAAAGILGDEEVRSVDRMLGP
jgi:protease secretion system outer membrane protein